MWTETVDVASFVNRGMGEVGEGVRGANGSGGGECGGGGGGKYSGMVSMSNCERSEMLMLRYVGIAAMWWCDRERGRLVVWR